ncbi:hypothetical protein TWF106_002796 [Orbilia oligospora]|uniref:BZIP transcription factor n=2 Tax=Orbilia oligospora TaxID=2813651 RepID=A0A6G1M0R5_ORBOL|nr:hypothetical protein TWF106_002796 [Orbilia oligospora]KAF3205298.1 hypothetical protein TWF191_001915 [Orbilia oligospora]KAF3213837.1 hypothetical protein TWF679_005156 [Orbilia oligospora]KAF3241216.1 hypothetical protein TWF192_009222 [Orbilia oligospora]
MHRFSLRGISAVPGSGMDAAERSPDSLTSPVHPGDDVNVLDLEDEEVDARTMSPRRNSEEMERFASEAKERLEKQAKLLQESLLALLDRVDKVREEHDKLEGENKFLQDYIGHLMQTSKITGSGGLKSSSNRGK